MSKRRDFIKFGVASAALASLPACSAYSTKTYSSAKAPYRVVVIGGGYAGTAAAKYLRLWSNGGIEVMVIEPRPRFVSCPLSNLVLGGSQRIGDLTFAYDILKAQHGIQWVEDAVSAINPAVRKVQLTHGELHYDKLIIAPGIDFIYDKLPMLQSAAAQQKIPHAWKAGEQTVNLRKQLEAMPDGGVFVISIPPAPYRCPPGPYERVCQVASYLKNNKPAAKIIVLDANPEITSKKALFTKAWAELYSGMIDYRPNSEVVNVDINTRTVYTEFESVKADVLNVILPQRAGKPAQMTGVVNFDNRWCEVDFLTYASTVHADIHVIGDSISSGLPKSAHMATSQAKVCANAIVAMVNNEASDPNPVFANTCYSFVNDNMAMHVANVYRYDATKKLMLPADGGGVSDQPSEQEGKDAQYWARNIWSDVLT